MAKKKHRSPNHPLFNLSKALERAKTILDADGLHKVPLPVAHERWGYKRKSAAGNQCVAALKAYGLLDVFGRGDSREVQITENARRILKDAPDKGELLKKAAFSPDLYLELWERYKDSGGLPQDDVLRQYLLWDRVAGTFNEDSVDGFIEDLRSTFRFAKIGVEDIVNDKDSPETPGVGSYVQWASQGADQFEVPRRVTRISDDDEWAFVEGSQAGIPMSEIAVVDPPKPDAPPVNPDYRPETNTEVASERIKLSEGAVELTMPHKLGRESTQDLQGWLDDLSNRANRRSGGANKSLPLPSGGTLHLISYPGSEKWCIRSYDFSWFTGSHLMTATVHAEPNGWESLEFDTPEDAVKFVEENPRPSGVPKNAK